MCEDEDFFAGESWITEWERQPDRSIGLKKGRPFGMKGLRLDIFGGDSAPFGISDAVAQEPRGIKGFFGGTFGEQGIFADLDLDQRCGILQDHLKARSKRIGIKSQKAQRGLRWGTKAQACALVVKAGALGFVVKLKRDRDRFFLLGGRGRATDETKRKDYKPEQAENNGRKDGLLGEDSQG